jgi:hypothetical protein
MTAILHYLQYWKTIVGAPSLEVIRSPETSSHFIPNFFFIGLTPKFLSFSTIDENKLVDHSLWL